MSEQLQELMNLFPGAHREFVPDALTVSSEFFETIEKQMNRLAEPGTANTILGIKVFKSHMPRNLVSMMRWNREKMRYDVVKVIQVNF